MVAMKLATVLHDAYGDREMFDTRDTLHKLTTISSNYCCTEYQVSGIRYGDAKYQVYMEDIQ